MLKRFFASSVPAFTLTPNAAQQVRKLLRHDFENKYMTIGLKDGGCAGFQYDFNFAPKPRKGDKVYELDGAKVSLDPRAQLFLRGATLDYVEDKFSSSFKIFLPNDSDLHQCSCGKSVGKDDNPGACQHGK